MKQILAAWAECPRGPGWANQIVWYLARDVESDTLEVRGLQRSELSAELMTLLQVSAVVHEEMTGALRRQLAKQKEGE